MELARVVLIVDLHAASAQRLREAARVVEERILGADGEEEGRQRVVERITSLEDDALFG